MASIKVDSITLERMAGNQRGQVRAAWKIPTTVFTATYTDSKGKKRTVRDQAWRYTEKYEYYWDYEIMVVGSDGSLKIDRRVTTNVSTTENSNVTFSVPDGATGVVCHVRPIAKKVDTYKSNTDSKGKVTWVKDTSKSYFSGAWSSGLVNTGAFHNPQMPEITSVKVSDDGLTVEVSVKSSDPYAKLFQVQGNEGEIQGSYSAKTDTWTYESSATVVMTGKPGKTYRIRARMQNLIGDWSSWKTWTGDKASTRPPAVGRPSVTATSGTTAVVTWEASPGASWYEIAYANDPKAFSMSSGYQTKSTKDSAPGITSLTFDDLDQGKAWFFWVRGVNASGEGEWSECSDQVVLGEPPAAPSIWADSHSVIRGRAASVTWQHNSSDGSAQRKAEVLYTTGSGWSKIEIDGPTAWCDIPTGGISDGSELKVYVRTYGVHPDPSPASETVTIGVWDRPTASISAPYVATAYPVRATVSTSAPRQQCVVLVLTATAVESHGVPVATGGEREVMAGEEVWRKVLTSVGNPCTVDLTPAEATLASGQRYVLTASCSMSSGLSCEASREIECDFAPLDVDVDGAVVAFGDWACEVIPAVYKAPDGEGVFEAEFADGCTVSVYRHETDGTMTPLLLNAPANDGHSVVDAHAALSGQVYRIVAASAETGAMEWADVSAPRRERLRKGLLVQWGGDAVATRLYGDDGYPSGGGVDPGTALFLPWSNSGSVDNDMDVELAEYMGDSHPTASYGTQLGQTASWSAEVMPTDAETLALLRELAAHRGDVYVRDKFGDGYWANVKPSWSMSDNSAKYDVTLKVTRTSTVDECIDLGGE